MAADEAYEAWKKSPNGLGLLNEEKHDYEDAFYAGWNARVQPGKNILLSRSDVYLLVMAANPTLDQAQETMRKLGFD